MENVRKRLIVALDYPSWEETEKLVLKLPEVKFFKVGLELYVASQGQAVSKLRELGKEVFLDLKFHDIPNTVAKACRQAAGQGAAILDVHAVGGRAMMYQSARAVQEYSLTQDLKKPLLIAITILTSMGEEDLLEVGMKDVGISVVRLARLAREADLDGVVASAREIALIREACGPDFKIICPGIRPLWSATGDQKRIVTPGEAVRLGADYLVVGRPITQAPDPREAALKVLMEMKEALA